MHHLSLAASNVFRLPRTGSSCTCPTLFIDLNDGPLLTLWGPSEILQLHQHQHHQLIIQPEKLYHWYPLIQSPNLRTLIKASQLLFVSSGSGYTMLSFVVECSWLGSDDVFRRNSVAHFILWVEDDDDDDEGEDGGGGSDVWCTFDGCLMDVACPGRDERRRKATSQNLSTLNRPVFDYILLINWREKKTIFPSYFSDHNFFLEKMFFAFHHLTARLTHQITSFLLVKSS